jgi:trehalose synthase
MLKNTKLEDRDLESYKGVAPDDILEEIRNLASGLTGLRVLHVSSTARGGGVAELLTSLVPLMKAVGLEAEWQIIFGDRGFFQVTKSLHNALQGQDIEITSDMRETYNKYSRYNADAFEGDWDIVVIDDPQPVAIPKLRNKVGASHWVWRCHIDLTDPNREASSFISPYLDYYDALIFTRDSYHLGHHECPRYNFTPCIDPLLPKNQPLERDKAEKILSSLDVDLSRPLVTQVSRFDPWKNPVGVIEMYRKIKKDVTDLQLALVGSIADDDPQGWDYYEKTLRNAGLDYDIKILQNYEGVHQMQVNAFQSLSDVIVQMSTREGFGLTVTEALWKERPVTASDVGGIKLQIENGVTGFLAENPDEFATKVEEQLSDRDRAKRMGKAARESVRQHFLTPRLLRDYLLLFKDLTSSGESGNGERKGLS